MVAGASLKDDMMFTSPGPLPLGSTDPVQFGPKTSIGSAHTTGAKAPETDGKPVTIAPADQAERSARLRDGEKTETTDRNDPPALDSPTGPPPAFRETPLERAERLSFAANADAAPPDGAKADAIEDDRAEPLPVPPSPTQKAESDFARLQIIDAGRPVPRLEITI